MAKYRKKPVIVEAVQWTGINHEEIKSFCGSSARIDICDTAWEVGKGIPKSYLYIDTLEGTHHASVGDFIIKGVKGEFYPCKPDIFAQTYESADDIDPETLRPKGRWIDRMVRDWVCSECGGLIQKVRNVDGYCYDDLPNYCPDCGAKMEG